MIRELKEVYARSGRYALLAPLLFAIPVVVEMVQHAVEIGLGFYDSGDAMRAAEGSALRMATGHVKVLALFAVGYWGARFLTYDDDPREARRLDPRALRLFVPVIAWGLLWLIVLQDGPLIARYFALNERAVSIGLVSVLLMTMAFEPCLLAWKVAAAAGNPRIGFIRSIRLTGGSYWWALGIYLILTMPLMIAHYAFAIAAVGQSRSVIWAMMALDSLLVGYMAIVMIAGSYVVARRVTARHGVALVGSDAAESQVLSIARA